MDLPHPKTGKSRLHVLAATRVSGRLAALVLVVTMALSMAVAAAVYLALLVRAEASGGAVLPISISSDRLDFGEVPFHGSVVRHLVLRNDGEAPVRVWFFASGDGYSVEPRELTLRPGIEFRVAVRASADRPGRHDGELLVHIDDDGGPLVIPLASRAPDAGETRHAAERPGLQACATEALRWGSAEVAAG